jgi:hypothetical protein
MYNWAVVVDGKITEYHYDIPQNWRHVSNLKSSQDDLPFLASLGWFPVRPIPVDYDHEQQQIIGYNYIAQIECVLAQPILGKRPKPLLETPPSPVSTMTLAQIQAELDLWKQTQDPSSLNDLADLILAKSEISMTGLEIAIRDHVCARFQYVNNDAAESWVETLLGQLAQRLEPKMLDLMERNRPRSFESMWQSLLDKIFQDLASENRSLILHQRHLVLQDLDNLKQRLIAILGWLEPWQTPPDEISEIRERRNALLRKSDWSQTTDAQATMEESTRRRWLVYRQALRDVPQQYLTNGMITWPEF